MQIALHMQVTTTNEYIHHLRLLGKIRDKYQTYCTTYMTHTMATHQGGTGHPIDRDIDLHIDVQKPQT